MKEMKILFCSTLHRQKNLDLTTVIITFMTSAMPSQTSEILNIKHAPYRCAGPKMNFNPYFNNILNR